jgi:predicted kinase
MAILIVFGGLPATGKSTLAKAIARERGAVYLRVDAIEQALRASQSLKDDVEDAGYRVAYALAESNLRLGRDVVADSVNPVAITRDAWRAIAVATPLLEIEVVCSDVGEHRRRVESRSVDVDGLKLPSWQDVLDRDYEPWDRPRLRLDTANRTVEDALGELRRHLESGQDRTQKDLAAAP